MQPLIPTDPFLEPHDVSRDSQAVIDSVSTGRDRIMMIVWIVAALLVVAVVFVALVATAPDESSTPNPSVDTNPTLEIPGL
jgi:putative exporter of polyketide antibiotics